MADIVNPQITDAVTTTETLELPNLQAIGVARARALAVAYQSLAQSLSTLMLNAVAAQQADATVNTAIVSLTVKRLTGGDTQPAKENKDV
jgi:hypothetical protein